MLMHPMSPSRSESVDEAPAFAALSIVTVGPDPTRPENARPSPVQRRTPCLGGLIRPVEAFGPPRLPRLPRQTRKGFASMRHMLRGFLPRRGVFQERA